MARYKCKGMEFSIDKLGTATTYVKVAQAETVGLPSPSNDPIDDTDLDSVAKEYSPGLPDNGTISIDLRFDPDDENHEYVEDWANDPVLKSVKVTLPTLPKDTYYTFDAFPTALDRPGGANEDKLMATLTLQVSGAPVKTKAP